MKYLALALLLSCHPVQFTTPCGVQYQGDVSGSYLDPEFNLQSMTQLESAAVDAGLVTCAELKGLALIVRPAPWVLYGDTGPRAGSTYCYGNWNRIEVCSPFKGNAFPHEAQHWHNRCLDADHSGWLDAGVWQKIEEVSTVMGW